MRSRSAQHHCRNRAEPLRRDPGFELPHFVRGSDEQHVHRAHAAAHFVGRLELNQRRSDNHADHVERTRQYQRNQRQSEAVRQPKDDREHAESADAVEHGPAGPPPQADCAQGQSQPGTAPTPEAARSTPNPLGPVCRISRAYTGSSASRAAQQHGEEIQRHAAENQLAAPDVAESVQDHADRLLQVRARAAMFRRMADSSITAIKYATVAQTYTGAGLAAQTVDQAACHSAPESLRSGKKMNPTSLHSGKCSAVTNCGRKA